MVEPDQSFIPTRQSLLSRLKNWDDQESWRDFFDTYGRLIYGLALKSGLTDAEAQDAVQETVLSVAKQMPRFTYNPALGSFKGWLLQITRRRIVDQLRKRQPAGSAGTTDDPRRTIEELAAEAPDPLSAIWESEWKKNLLEVAMGRVRRHVHPKQFQMFDLYVTQQWPMESVTSTLAVSPAQVYMAKLRVGRMIRSEIRALETKLI